MNTTEIYRSALSNDLLGWTEQCFVKLKQASQFEIFIQALNFLSTKKWPNIVSGVFASKNN